jgi:hypothetical protein
VSSFFYVKKCTSPGEIIHSHVCLCSLVASGARIKLVHHHGMCVVVVCISSSHQVFITSHPRERKPSSLFLLHFFLLVVVFGTPGLLVLFPLLYTPELAFLLAPLF